MPAQHSSGQLPARILHNPFLRNGAGPINLAEGFDLQRRRVMADTIREKIENAGQAAKDGLKTAAEKIKDGAEVVAEKTANAAKAAGQAAKDAGQKLKDKSGA
jgi:hypothetical protein